MYVCIINFRNSQKNTALYIKKIFVKKLYYEYFTILYWESSFDEDIFLKHHILISTMYRLSTVFFFKYRFLHFCSIALLFKISRKFISIDLSFLKGCTNKELTNDTLRVYILNFYFMIFHKPNLFFFSDIANWYHERAFILNTTIYFNQRYVLNNPILLNPHS